MDMFSLEFPLIQGGMVWVSGHRLATACAQNGILGTLSAGSMTLEVLKNHLEKCFDVLNKVERKRLAVNIPLLYEGAKDQIELACKLGVEVFITSAGSPKLFTSDLKNRNKKILHVTSNPELAMKCEDAGVDAVIAEGFEAGGHNGRDELTSFVLIPQVVDAVKIPVVAAGGISDARGIFAAQILGAQGAQMGTRFLLTQESRAHEKTKKIFLQAKSTDTFLRLKKHVPVRLLNNKFSKEIQQLEEKGASLEELKAHLGKGRAKLGLHDGDIENGELEIGQVVGRIKNLPSCSELIQKIRSDYISLIESI